SPGGQGYQLVGPNGVRTISLKDLEPVSVDHLLLQIAPIRDRQPAKPEQAFVLTDAALYLMLSRYLRDHHMNYQVARVPAPAGRNYDIIRIEPRHDTPTGTQLPTFLLSYLSSLPRTSVLTLSGSDGSRRMLVEWGYRHPCQPQNILGVFPADSLIL